MTGLLLRKATLVDSAAISDLMRRAIVELQREFLTLAQIESSAAGMGLDKTLIEDGTYFVVEDGQTLVGCGGWSYRATLYGGSHSGGRDDRILNPQNERAKIRAMYTHPDYVRRGVGRMVIDAGEAAAHAYGFTEIEMAATMAGKPFYLKCGYTVEYEWMDDRAAEPVPLAKMVKVLL